MIRRIYDHILGYILKFDVKKVSDSNGLKSLKLWHKIDSIRKIFTIVVDELSSL